MNKRKELTGFLCFLGALLIFTCVASEIVLPKRHDYGATWGMYAKEQEESVDVLFLGSSLVYCNVVPSVIYKTSGYTSYLMSGPEQLMPITYWYLKEICKRQSPKVVFIEATGMFFDKYSRSTKVNLCYMPWNFNRLIPTFEETEGEERTGLLLPLFAYHDRWDELHHEDIEDVVFGYQPDMLAGYTFLDMASPMSGIEKVGYPLYPETYQRNLEYAGKIVKLCKEQGIRPIFYLTPNCSKPTDQLTSQLRSDLACVEGELLDFNEAFNSYGLTMETDFFDKRHFNYRGAEKFSVYLGELLADWEIPVSENEDEALWQERISRFEELRDAANSKPKELWKDAS